MVYLLHFETFLCCLVIAAAWLFNIIFVDLHSVLFEILLKILCFKQKKFYYSRRNLFSLFSSVLQRFNTIPKMRSATDSMNIEHGRNDSVCVVVFDSWHTDIQRAENKTVTCHWRHHCVFKSHLFVWFESIWLNGISSIDFLMVINAYCFQWK